MKGLRQKDVITMSLDDDYINKALKIHGIILPSDLSLTLVDKKEILFILLLDLNNIVVKAHFVYKGLNVEPTGFSTWFNVSSSTTFNSIIKGILPMDLNNVPYTEEELREKYMHCLHLRYKDVLSKSFEQKRKKKLISFHIMALN